MIKNKFIWIPLVLLVFFISLSYHMIGKDTKKVPSVLIDKPLPHFALQTLKQEEMITDTDLKGQVFLLNIWASWCEACRAETKVLHEIAKTGIKIYGINYKDKRTDAIAWLKHYHDPYLLSIQDVTGDLGIDLGVYGVPETFVIDKFGVISKKWIGELTLAAWQNELQPLFEQLQK